MLSRRESLRKIGHILKRTSIEMRRITSVEVVTVPDTPVTKACLYSSEISGCVYDSHADFCIDSQIEFNLNDELLAGMETIVCYRMCLLNALSKIPLGDEREERKSILFKKMQGVESRALVFLTLPPTKTSGCDDLDGINITFFQFLEEAESYLAKADDLISNSSTVKENTPVITPNIPENSPFPGFSQQEALNLKKISSKNIFSILSDPELRVVTSTVKTIIGSACSQITGGDPQHCLNRLNYLLALFEGSPVRPPGAGAESFRLPQNVGAEFAWHCLIKAALAQAERQFAFSLSSTLPFAAVLAALLGRFPNYVPLFLAHLATACPFLTLYADNADTVLMSLEASGGIDEEVMQNWRGICRLFAAVLLARLPPGFKDRPEHLNPKLLWITISGVARHKNKLEITAVVLRGLIETGGYVLLKLYKRQAERLFRSLIDAVGDSQSSWELALVTCLELLLDQKTSSENGHGVIFDDFWD